MKISLCLLSFLLLCTLDSSIGICNGFRVPTNVTIDGSLSIAAQIETSGIRLKSLGSGSISISASPSSSDSLVTIPNTGSNSNVILSEGNHELHGIIGFSSGIKLGTQILDTYRMEEFHTLMLYEPEPADYPNVTIEFARIGRVVHARIPSFESDAVNPGFKVYLHIDSIKPFSGAIPTGHSVGIPTGQERDVYRTLHL